MIRKMRKLQLLLHRDDRESLLNRIQELGVLHVCTRQTGGTRQLGEDLDVLRNAVGALTAFSDEWKPNLPPDNYRGSALELARNYADLTARYKLLMDQRADCLRDIEILRPFGNFDPELLTTLGNHRIRVTLCSIARNLYVKLPRHAAVVQYLAEWYGGIYFVVITHQQDRISEDVQRLLACETAVPRQSLANLEKTVAELELEIDRINRERIDLSRFLEWLQAAAQTEADKVLLALSGQSLEEGAAGSILILQGFFPASEETALRNCLAQFALVPIISDPSPHEQVPVSLKNDPFSRLFEPIMKIFSLPNYRELDPTPFFAPFYTLFFGLCLADFGYGILLLAAALGGLLFIKKAAIRPYLLLGAIFALSVMLAGVMLDDYFGVRIGEGTGSLPADSAPVLFRLGWFRNQNDAMLLPLMLGVIQVLFGLALRVVNQVKHLGAQGALQPIGTIALFFGTLVIFIPRLGESFAIGPVPVGQWFSVFPAGLGTWLVLIGLALILLFNGLEKGTKIWFRPLTGLWKLYELATGMPGDILSYVRLFALGLAGGLLAEAVNNIAMMLTSGSGLLRYVAMALVLLVGHGLNLAIGMLSAFVHSLRLTFVEFYKALEFTGGGLAYSPLKKSKANKLIPPALEPRRGEQ